MKLKLLILMILALTVTACGSEESAKNTQMVNNNFSTIETELKYLKERITELENIDKLEARVSLLEKKFNYICEIAELEVDVFSGKEYVMWDTDERETDFLRRAFPVDHTHRVGIFLPDFCEDVTGLDTTK